MKNIRYIPHYLCVSFSLFIISIPPALSQENSFTIVDALKTTLQHNPSISIKENVIIQAEGNHRSARGKFDPAILGSIDYQKNRTPSLIINDTTLIDPVESEDMVYGLGIQNLFRSGTKGSINYNLTHTDDEVPGTLPNYINSTLTFSIITPLGSGRKQAITADEQLSSIEIESSKLLFKQTISETLLQATNAYWEYVAAWKIYSLKSNAEKRTTKLTEDTKKLVKANERPATDIAHVKANLASKTSDKISARQQLFQARQKLGLTLGLDNHDIDNIPPPTTIFPTISQLQIESLPDVSLFTKQSLQTRGDYQSALLNEKSAQINILASKDQLKPEIDFHISVGLVSLTESESIGAVIRDSDNSTNFIMGLTGKIPIGNNLALGNLTSAEAKLTQAKLARKNLKRNILSNITTILNTISDLSLSLKATEESVQYYMGAVKNEVRKLQLGMATLIDVTTMDNNYTDAQINNIYVHSELAKAVATLRNETDTLITSSDNGFYQIEDVISLPIVKDN